MNHDVYFVRRPIPVFWPKPLTYVKDFVGGLVFHVSPILDGVASLAPTPNSPTFRQSLTQWHFLIFCQFRSDTLMSGAEIDYLNIFWKIWRKSERILGGLGVGGRCQIQFWQYQDFGRTLPTCNLVSLKTFVIQNSIWLVMPRFLVSKLFYGHQVFYKSATVNTAACADIAACAATYYCCWFWPNCQL